MPHIHAKKGMPMPKAAAKLYSKDHNLLITTPSSTHQEITTKDRTVLG
jgi:hypothetical protein